jgi:hypothetical protein
VAPPAGWRHQAVWQNVTVTVAGQQRRFTQGELLPSTAVASELAERATLTQGGALQSVYAVFDETAVRAALEQGLTRGTAGAVPSLAAGQWRVADASGHAYPGLPAAAGTAGGAARNGRVKAGPSAAAGAPQPAVTH